MNWLLPLLLLPLTAAPTAQAPASEVELNALSVLIGTRSVAESGEPNGEAIGLIDGSVESSWEEPWEEGEAPTAILQLPEPFDLSALEVVNSNREADWPGASVKRMRVETGASAGGPWKRLAELKLAKGTKPQRTKVSAKKVRFVRVTLLENHGGREWWGVGELRAIGTRCSPRKIDFNGAWETDYGEIRLEQNGERIFGCYGTEEKNGLYTVEGSVEGSVFSGTWREQSADGAVNTGDMVLALTAEGDLSGVWGSKGSLRDRRWDGKPKAEPGITCEKPEKTLDKELAKGRVVLRGILFDTGKATLKSESIAVLEALSAAMKKGGQKYVIEGHTDDRGGKDYNQKLSEQRAASVKEWLVKSGIDAKRLRPVGYGMTKPVMPNDSEAGRVQNRRVEVAVDK